MAAAIGGALAGAAVQMIGPVSETLTQVIVFAISDFFSPSSSDSQDYISPQDSVIRIRCGLNDGGAEGDLGKQKELS